eukprot:403335272
MLQHFASTEALHGFLMPTLSHFLEILPRNPFILGNSDKMQLSQTFATAPLTESRFGFISSNTLLVIRIINFLFDLYFTGQTLKALGLVYTFPYLSAWANFVSLGTHILLIYSHFRSYDLYYDELVKAIFEISLPLQWLTTSGFWLIVNDGDPPINWSEPSTLYYTVYMHGPSLIAMTIEGFLNTVTFDVQNGAMRMLWLLVSYVPLQLFSKQVLDYYPYGELDLSTLKSWISLLQPIPGGMAFYYAWAYLINFLKNRVETKHKIHSIITNVFENLNQLI